MGVVEHFNGPTILLVAGVLLAITWLRQYRRSKLLPPGPPRLPVIGNLHQAPQEYPWRQYQKWTQQYGPIFSLQYGLDTIIMLGNYEVTNDLLNKRSNIYSSRPHLIMGDDCVSKGNRALLMPYGPQYRNHQRLWGSFLNPRASKTYTSLQDVESKQLVYEMLSTSDFSDRYHRYASSLVFGLAYGRRLPRGDEPELKAIDQIMENFLYAARVGTWIVDALPILNYIPFAPWKRLGNKFHAFESKLYMDILERGKKGSWSQVPAPMMPPKEHAYAVGILYEAGSDTTTMALEIFTLAMLLHPEAMKKAQAELDALDDFPTFDSTLPYIDATVKEVLRWRPVSAGGIPHAVTQDDYYMGYLIPKGATVVGNFWSISMDESVYEDPYTFRPERWLENPDLPLATFGFGRRICTGQHIAKNSLFINIARLLWAFDIEYAYDENGKKYDVDPFAFTQGFNSRPLPFKASFVPRSEEKRMVVERVWNECEKDEDVLLAQLGQSQKMG